MSNLLRRLNRNPHYIGSLRIGLAITDLSNHAFLGLAGVGCFLPRALVRPLRVVPRMTGILSGRLFMIDYSLLPFGCLCWQLLTLRG
jgi:hypothetical protein